MVVKDADESHGIPIRNKITTRKPQKIQVEGFGQGMFQVYVGKFFPDAKLPNLPTKKPHGKKLCNKFTNQT